MKLNLKSLITLIIVTIFSLAFGFVVIKYADEETARVIITTFSTIATSTVGFFIGYQTNKPTQMKSEEEKDKE